MDAYSGAGAPHFSCVRYGNVVGSRGIVAAAAFHHVVVLVAGDPVGQVIAVAPGRVELEVLDVGGQRVGAIRPHRVGAFAVILEHVVADVLDLVHVVAETAVGRSAASQAVSAAGTSA